MIIIACTDDNQGMLFNHRRQSQDRVQRQRMLEQTGERKLWVDTYTARMFSGDDQERLEIDDQCLEHAGDGEYCFVEKEDLCQAEEKIEKIIFIPLEPGVSGRCTFPYGFKRMESGAVRGVCRIFP